MDVFYVMQRAEQRLRKEECREVTPINLKSNKILVIKSFLYHSGLRNQTQIGLSQMESIFFM